MRPIHPWRPLLIVAACLLLTLSLAPLASASLVLSQPGETSGTGLGAVNTVLTIQESPPEDMVHSGCVAWNGTMDVIGPAACPTGIAGGDEQTQTQTRTVSEVGISSAINLRIVFNYNEPQSGPDVNDITIEDLVLTIYGSGGGVCFTSGPFTPETFLDTFSGVGNSGFVFRLDPQQTAQAQPCMTPDARLGLASTLSGAGQGPETFFIADATNLGGPTADLAVTKEDDPDPVAVGGTLTYTVTVTNQGPNAATGVTVVDTLPSSVTFGSATVTTGDGTCTVDGRIVTCQMGTLNPGDSEVITLTVTSTSEGNITNNVLVSGDQPDGDAADNTASESTTVGVGSAEQVDVSIIKSDTPDPVVVGSPLTYTLEVRNAGPDDATGVTVTDRLPASVTFDSATPGTCSESGGTVTCELGTLVAGALETVEITVTPTATGTLDNFAQVSANEGDTNLGNNSDREETLVVNQPPEDQVDLVVSKSDSTDPVTAGNDFTYTVQVTNVGSTGATGVTVVDNLPGSVAFVSASAGCNHTSGTVTCDLGALAAGAMTSVSITVTAPGSSTTLTNTASATADQPDLDPSDNSATEQTTVELGGEPPTEVADLSITKTDSPDPVSVGQLFTYTLTVFNAGPDGASGLTVSDNLSPLVSFFGADPAAANCSHDGSLTGGTVTCDVGALAAGDSLVITLTVTAEESGTADDFAAVSANQADGDTGNNSATERTTIGVPGGVIPAADLRLLKSGSPDPVAVGATLTYSLTVTNNGPDLATGVVVADTLPATVECLDASSPETPAGGTCACPPDSLGGTVTCDLGDLAVDGSAILTIQVRPTQAGTLLNSAIATADQAEPAFADNTDEAVVSAQEASVLAIPTLGEWSLLLLGLLLGIGGLWVLRSG